MLTVDSCKRKLTTTQATALQDRRTALLRKIQKFRDVQDIYMPGLRAFLDRTQPDLSDREREMQAENLDIHLPSSLDPTNRTVVCIAGVVDVEDRLRYGQAFEALEDLRRQLRTRTFTTKFKARQVVGQGAYTRTRVLQDQIESKIRSARARYDAARKALFSLRGAGQWEETLQVLRAEDIRALNERTLTAEEKDADERARQLAGMVDQGQDDGDHSVAVREMGIVELGEGRRQLSWIWYRVTAEEVDGDAGGTLNEGMFFPSICWLAGTLTNVLFHKVFASNGVKLVHVQNVGARN